MAGFTKDEEILAAFGKASFLCMWTWPNLFRDQGKTSEASDGKEICDLTVIFGDALILFSDKRIDYSTEKPADVAWCRWVRRAISGSLKQLEGAERWLRHNGNRVFIDKACTTTIPIELPNLENLKIFQVVVAHGLEAQLRDINDEGSLSFTNRIKGKDNWDPNTAKQFVIGNPSESGFVHVFTDETIKLVLSEFDTAEDFISYLNQRESLLSLEKPVDISKESDIVHLFYENYQDDKQGRIILSAPELIPESVVIAKPPLKRLYENPSFRYKKEADQTSYFWDGLIDAFTFHAMNGTSVFRNWDHTSEIEPALRVMASPGRFSRRVLAQAFIDFYCLLLGGLKPPASAGSFEHEHVPLVT